jgi:uncharacterized protein with PhoU and TrkA domain
MGPEHPADRLRSDQARRSTEAVARIAAAAERIADAAEKIAAAFDTPMPDATPVQPEVDGVTVAED